jgi:nucleoside-diphosphate-sugar epimerase
MATQKILITGGTGYLGTSLLKILAKNFKVKLITRNRLIVSSKNVEVIKVKDLFSLPDKWWISQLKDTKYFIHLAWYVKQSDYISNSQNLSWMFETIRIAEIVKKYSEVSKFIGIGSEQEYGDGIYKKNLKYERPYSTYGFAKITTFYFLQQIFFKTKIDFTWCRVFKLYGGKNEKNSRLYPYLLKCKNDGKKPLLKNKKIYFDSLHVRKAAKKIFNLIDSKKSKIVNIKSGKRTLISTFASNVLQGKI